MGEYDQLLAQIKTEYEQSIKYIRKFADSANVKIPKLCEALQKEETDDTKLSYDDIIDRIYKDCLQFWQRDTIRKAFPDWIKREYEITVNAAGHSATGDQYHSSYSLEGVTIPEDESEKFKYDDIKNDSILLKRHFGFYLKDVQEQADIQKIFNDAIFLERVISNLKDRIEKTGSQNKYHLVNPITDQVKQLRKPISVYNLNFVAHARLTDYIKEGNEDLLLSVKQLQNIINSSNKYAGAFSVDEAKHYRNACKMFLIQVYNSVNNKSSQPLSDQMETDIMRVETTANQAAKNMKTMTMICISCIKTFSAENNDDPPLMQLDQNSPTGYRCPKCLGISMKTKGLTKDIVVQRETFLQEVAKKIILDPPMKVFEIFGKVNARISGAKKELMSRMLEQSSFGSSKPEFK